MGRHRRSGPLSSSAASPAWPEPPAPSAWEAPGAEPTGPVAAPAGGAARPEISGPAEGVARPTTQRRRAPLPPFPIPRRPLRTADLLDGSFLLLRRRPADILTIAAVAVLPIRLVVAVAANDLLADAESAGGGNLTSVLFIGGEKLGVGLALGLLALDGISLGLAAAAVAALVKGWYVGADVTPAAALGQAVRRLPVLLAAYVLVHAVEAVGLLACGLGALVAAGLFHIVTPIVVIEEAGPLRAMRRSAQLSRRRIANSVMLPILVGVVSFAVAPGVFVLGEVVAAMLPGGVDWVARGAVQLASELVIAPFVAGVAVLYYLDLRVRTEGLDLELRTVEVFE